MASLALLLAASAGIAAFLLRGPRGEGVRQADDAAPTGAPSNAADDRNAPLGGGFESDDGPGLSQSSVQVDLAAAERSAAQTSIDLLAEKANPNRDDWTTEQLAESVGESLGKLQRVIEDSDENVLSRLRDLVSADFLCDDLRPGELTEVYRDPWITVRRSRSATAEGAAANRGAGGLRSALEQLSIGLGKTGRRHAKFKVVGISVDGDQFETDIRFEANAKGSHGTRQQTATWKAAWDVPVGIGSLPKLRQIRLSSYEECAVAAPSGSLFSDCTKSALANEPSYETQILPGLDHWLTRLPREFLGQFGHQGLAVGDANGDGLDDLYVCEAGGLPNRLYIQQPDGSVRDVSAAAGVDFLDDSTGALLVDLDNDGDQDLIVAVGDYVHIARNDGAGGFTLAAPMNAKTDAHSLAAADPDGDGDLDVYVCGYNVRAESPTNRGLPFPWPYFDANNGGRNLFLRNEGGLKFVDATDETGLNVNNTRFSFAASWEDFDNDGDQDLYVANDFGRNNLYRNDGGKFTDIAAEADVEDQASGMSVSWADYNLDGRMDVYVGNMFSSAGNRVTFQNRFSDGRAAQDVAHLRRMARGNTLFANVSGEQGPAFRDVSLDEGVAMGRWAWASAFTDLTNDGWPDLLVANGYVTNSKPDDL